MISRDLVLTITDKGVSLDKAVTLYRFDRGITLNIKLESDTYDLTEEITKARAIVLRPNKKVSATEITDIVDGVYVLHLDNTWADHLSEVGIYQIQLQLYSDNPDDECITVAPFTFEVKNPVGIPTDTPAYVDIATANNYSIGYNTDAPIGDLANGEYLQTEWIGGDLITAGKLNKIETTIDFLVGESATHATKEDIPTVPANISEFNNDAGFATETYVNDAIEGIDLSNYATKDDIGDIDSILDNLNGEVI